MNDNIMRQIINGESEYYIARKKGVSNGLNKYPDDIYLIGIPDSVPRNSDIDKMYYGELLKLSDTCIDYNIPLNCNHPPFQRGLKLSSFCEIVELKKYSTKLVAGLLILDSNNFIDYLSFMDDFKFATENNFVSN